MAKQVAKKSVEGLFELQTKHGSFLTRAKSEAECKSKALMLCATQWDEVVVYQKIGSFVRPNTPAVWKKLAR